MAGGGQGLQGLFDFLYQTGDKTSDHHPVTYTSQVPPHPFTEAPTTKRKVFRKLTERERSKHHDSLAPLARWCESTLPRFESLSSADIELFTDVVLEEVATSYHSITTPSRPTSSAQLYEEWNLTSDIIDDVISAGITMTWS